MCFQSFTDIHPHRHGRSVVSISIWAFDPLSLIAEFTEPDVRTNQNKREWRRLRNQVLGQRDPEELLDVLLALARTSLGPH
jgi:hypothetical protein